MTRRRWAGATVVALAMLSFTPAVASAASPTPSPSSYAATNPTLTLSSAVAHVGKAFVISGSGFSAGETIDISVSYGPAPQALGSSGAHVSTASFSLHSVGSPRREAAAKATADNSGDFSQRLTLAKVGVATITAKGESSGLTLTSTVTVRPAVAAAAPASVKTKASLLSGTNLLILAGAGAALVGIGGWLLVRRKRPSSYSRAHAPASVA